MQIEFENIPAAGRYSLCRSVGNLLFTAGMTPRGPNGLLARGVVGTDISIQDARKLVSVATTRAIHVAEACAAKHQRVLQEIVMVTVYVRAHDSFREHSQVADGAEEALQQWRLNTELPARAAVGVSSLPSGSPIEVQLVGVSGNVVDTSS